KTNLFLVSGLVYALRGSFELKVLGGLQTRPLLMVLFLVPAMSLAGIPPLSGFFAKLSLVNAGFDSGDYTIVAVSLVVGFLTLYSMTKIWNEVFAKPPPDEPAATGVRPALLQLAPAVMLAALTIAIGLGAGPMLDLTNRAGEQLLDRAEYISAVLDDDTVP